MKKIEKKSIYLNLITDWFTAFLSWIFLFFFRKIYIENFSYSINLFQKNADKKLFLGLFIIPIFWLILYFFSNTYFSIYKKSRYKEFIKTILQTFFGSIILFFALFLNDKIRFYKDYYLIFIAYSFVHFMFTILGRYIILNNAKNKIASKQFFITTLIIGNHTEAEIMQKEFDNATIKLPNKIIKQIDFIDIELIKKELKKNAIEEVIFANNYTETEKFNTLLVYLFKNNIAAKIFSTNTKTNTFIGKLDTILGVQLVEIPNGKMPVHQLFLKRIIDIFGSIFGLVVFSPIFIFIALKIKKNIIYRQERIGQNGKPFTMYKFRSMIVNAENLEPQLSKDNDTRITKLGKFLRQYRLDELPQLYNVLIGEMSLVGIRPERLFYIHQLKKVTPKYELLQTIKPGITSLGMIKFGYASNLLEMQERLKYDWIYFENINIGLDFKIMIYTIFVLLKGKGK